MKTKLFAILAMLAGLSPVNAFAGAMAVSLDDLYLYNNNKAAITLQVNNLDGGQNQFSIPAHGICKVDQHIPFLPFSEESNNFVVMLTSSEWQNPIVIDQFGLLSLASDSALKLPYTGKVKGYSLLGFCGNKLGQYKFLNVVGHENSDRAPNFNLANCSATSNYVYYINDNYVKVKNRLKSIDFSKVKACSLADAVNH